MLAWSGVLLIIQIEDDFCLAGCQEVVSSVRLQGQEFLVRYLSGNKEENGAGSEKVIKDARRASQVSRSSLKELCRRELN